MKKIKPNSFYKATKTVVVETYDPTRVPMYKLYNLKEGEKYLVNAIGELETDDGPAKITESVAESLKYCYSHEEIEFLKSIRTKAAIQLYNSFLSSESMMLQLLKRAEREHKPPFEMVAICAIEHAEILAKELVDKEDEWLQEL